MKKKLKGISLTCDRITAMNFTRWFRVSKLGERIIHKFVIPKGNIFKGRFLQFVELNEYVLKNGLPFKGCVNIKTLKLGGCLLGDNTLVEILKNYKELEKLTLRHCSCMSTDYNIGPSRDRCFVSIIASVLDALLTYTMTNFVGSSNGITTRSSDNIFTSRYIIYSIYIQNILFLYIQCDIPMKKANPHGIVQQTTAESSTHLIIFCTKISPPPPPPCYEAISNWDEV
ncbi:hypothetical protein R3W88_015621 [Solanum pinnatisectum]|uniref:Uncharacterized protein n=1 Tax=Solanum pinnatisectum TaxID=50273 RepID=A0AAV9KWB2_9SOLN|nr:hypothetical protein R3W88_015621 [Solanum pinnatisectum]